MIEELNVYVHPRLAVNIKVLKRKSRAGFCSVDFWSDTYRQWQALAGVLSFFFKV